MNTRTSNILLRLFVLFTIWSSCYSTVSAQTPVANFTANQSGGCSPLLVSFQDQSTGNPTQWNWNFGNGNTSTLRNPSATYFTAGTYTVSLTVTNTNGSNTLTRTQYVSVFEIPTADFSASPVSGCFPVRVQCTDLSAAGTGNTNTNWLWDFGNGTTSTLQNPQTIYTTAGAYTITLKVTNDKGCVNTISKHQYINVSNGVVSGFTHTSSLVCSAPASISFTNTSTGPGVLAWFWDFGDGATSSAQNPVHIYNSNGTYTATLVTFSNAGCVDTVRSTPILIGGFNSAISVINPVCVQHPIWFSNVSNPAPVSAVWNFGDGGTVNGIHAVYGYANPGIYTVWVHNNFGSCQDSGFVNLTVLPEPVTDFTAPVTSSCQAPLTVNFQDLTGPGATSWLWDFGDGTTSVLQNPVHVYSDTGHYTVSLTVFNAGGCSVKKTKPAFIKIKRASIAINRLPAQGCLPFTITPVPVINAVDPIVSYQWDFGDGGSSTAQNPVYTYNVQGTYTVQLIVTSLSGCKDTLTLTDAIHTGSKPHADFTADPLQVCGRKPIVFNNLSSPATSWVWHFGDGDSSVLQNPIHSYGDMGFYTVMLVANNNGCRDTMIKTNYLHILPPFANFVPIPHCDNRLIAEIVDLSIGALTWDWDFGDGTYSSVPVTSHTYSSYGNYAIKLVVSNGACKDSIVRTVHLLNENPDFTADRTAACKEARIIFTATNINQSNITNYAWDFGDDSTIQTASNITTHNYTTSGNYTVTLVTTDINRCMDTVTKTNYVRINGPVASFSTNTPGGCAGLQSVFTDQSSSDGTNSLTGWTWDFGDGTVQQFTEGPFEHAYNSPGVFSVKLTVTDILGCMDSLLITNLITTTNPIASFKVSDTVICPNGNISFTNLSIPAGYTSKWSFGDGTTSVQNSPAHTYSDTGYYSVSLYITDGFGCKDTLDRPDYIHIDQPKASFTMNDSITSCIPIEVQFTNTSHFTSSVSWNFGPGQGNSTMNNPVHYYSTPGNYLIKLYTTSPGGCIDSATGNVKIFDNMNARVNYLPVGGCKPLFVDLNAFSPGPMTSYLWDYGDGYTDTSSLPVNNHLYTSFGNYLPKVIMKDPSGCLIPVQGLDTVYVTGAKARFGVDNHLFCDRGIVTFLDSTTFNDPIRSYQWSFGDGTFSDSHNPVHTYSIPGFYTVTLNIQTQLGCLDSFTNATQIKVIQSPQTDIAGDTLICINNSLIHTGVFTVSDSASVNWQWTFPNGNHSTLQNPPKQFYGVAGDFTVTSVVTNTAGCADTTRKNIHIKPLPTVNMPGQFTVQTGFPVKIPATFSAGTNNWIWSPADGLDCFRCPNPVADPNFNTIYQVYFTDQYGCANLGRIEANVICKNANLFIPNTFSPNGDGNNDVFYPRGKGLERVKLLRIFNRWGQIVFERRDFPVNDAMQGWNGTFNNKKPQADVYVYQAEVYCDNGEIIRLNGNISLLQ